MDNFFANVPTISNVRLGFQAQLKNISIVVSHKQTTLTSVNSQTCWQKSNWYTSYELRYQLTVDGVL